MTKNSSRINIDKKNDKLDKTSKEVKKTLKLKNNDYLLSMSLAPEIGQSTHWFQMLPAAFFTAVIIIITRMASYQRPMGQFFWSTETTDLVDFFS
ncbi:MAG TPA: hypothetical protein VEA58_10130, partial [Anaerovoracaceae bacterium]|nr:hypothetical protein [Anaerovoracaceae bacterium]